MAFKKYLLPLLLLIAVTQLSAQKVDPRLFDCIKWRMIGPYRGGRTVGASGDLRHPNIFYIGVNNGGVWKTTDFGRTWNPIFDSMPTGSIGDVAVSPSDPNVIYVASGEGLQRPDLSVGDGMYKSVDAGKTWKHLGLSKGLQIGGISIDPKDENRVFAAVLGHPYGANEERGIYRSTDGGKTWNNVLYIDENTGAIQVTIDPVSPNIVYADMFAHRLAPWENGEWGGPASGLYKSTDGGTTWKPLKTGLPGKDDGLGRIGFCIAPSDHNRLYAVVSSNEKTGGIYRSDDAGESWTKINADNRLWERGDDFAELKVDPKNKDIVYDANVVTWKSTDAGKTWTGWKGAPGGDDYHRLWINPYNTDIILLASDQGAGITVNGGQTWSSWYNQPTAQLYHVSADNAFPYNVYSGQQESGSVGIASRGNDGAISFRDWHPVNAEEYGYVVADPLDPNIVFGGKISRFDKRTCQSVNISPEVVRSGKYRFIRTAPIVFSPVDNKTLFYAGNVLFKTRNGGNSWEILSPDLTRSTYDVPTNIGVYRNDEMKTMPQRGVIYTIAPSPLDSNIIWIGTDDGLIQVTHNNGKTWENVTPPALTCWSKVSLMDASHTDKNTAYAAVNRIRLDDYHPHIYKTADGGKTWKEIVKGLPNDPVNVVKEDPIRKGLLFAGSERSVYVSFDDGENWQSLRHNMPATSIRDLVIKDNDIIVATHGRSFWIMDDITALRDIAAMKKTPKVVLYKPQAACRVRWDMNTDTPLPQDEPVGKNPPDGAIIDYYLKEDAKSDIRLSIFGPKGSSTMTRVYSSRDTLYKIPKLNIPLYWLRPQQILSPKAGSHRFLWDMHYQPLSEQAGYSMSAIFEDTPPAASSPWAPPGDYLVILYVDGKQYEQWLHVYMDPRVKTSGEDLQKHDGISYSCYNTENWCSRYENWVKKSLKDLKQLKLMDGDPLNVDVDSLIQKADILIGNSKATNLTSFPSIKTSLNIILQNLQSADVAPTEQCKQAFAKANDELDKSTKEWNDFNRKIKELNKLLKKRGQKAISFMDI